MFQIDNRNNEYVFDVTFELSYAQEMELTLFIIGAIFGLVVASMFIFSRMADQYYSAMSRRRIKKAQSKSPYNKKDPPKKPKRDDEFISKDKVREAKKQSALDRGVSVYNPRGQEAQLSADDSQIVDVVKPVGRWSSFIMKQKMGFILAMGGLSGNKKGGFWTNLIKAQAASRGKGESKGR